MERSEVNRILQNLGLEQYIDTFKENQINDVSLESIGKEDLAEVVPAVGHRAMIWSELSKLKTGSVYVTPSTGVMFVRDVVEHESNNYGETFIDKTESDSFSEELANVKVVMNTTVEKIVNFITSLVKTDTPKEEMLLEIQKLKDMSSMLDKFDTRYKLDKFLIENQFIVMPKEIVLDTDISFPTTLLTGQMQKYKAITMQYVPMKNTILQLLSSPGFFQILEMNKSYNSEVLKTVDLKTSSVNSVLNQVVKELKDLWSNGITFNYNGHDLNFKIALAQVSGDNLGLHTLLGLLKVFTANYPCRRCKLHKNECRKATTECREKLRNLDNYEEDVAAEDFPLTGINFESILNELPYLHVTQIYVFDIMHDILEGVAPDLLLNTINYFIKKKILTLDKLNHRLESFDYGRATRLQNHRK
ncbi:hypothetical protein Ocin01_18408 [Orchesella cincta]|uniref:SAM domain-containing protein n=1 Tax=Orchesella cincta TaxID=48709 RepID=A0A1D2M5M3_ORCCI|nr:hypothetical protein Ocin01_18408 [Orchesella cincta]